MPVPRPKTSTPSQPVPFSDFAPDQDPLTPGAIQDAFNVFPIERGFRSFPGIRRFTQGMPSKCLGAFAGVIAGVPLLIAGNQNALYVGSPPTAFGLSAGGYNTQGNRWRFAPYGNDVVAVDGVDLPQFVDFGAFPHAIWATLPKGSTDGSPPPIASIVEATDYNFIFVLPNSQTFLSSLGIFPVSWLGSVPNQVYIQSIIQSQGDILGAHRLRNAIVFYKRSAMHIGYFAGGNIGWDIQDISLQIGTFGQEAVINTGDYHYFPGSTMDFWQFDGWNLTRMQNHVAEFFRRDLDENNAANIAGQFDEDRNLLLWYYPSKAANPVGSLDSVLIHYLRTSKWAFQRLSVDLPIPNVIQPNSYLGYFGIDHAPHVYDETLPSQRSYVTSNFYGDNHWIWECNRVRPAFGQNAYPDSAVCTPQNQYVQGTPSEPGQPEPLSDDGWFNLINSSRLMAFQVAARGTTEYLSIEPILQQAGEL